MAKRQNNSANPPDGPGRPDPYGDLPRDLTDIDPGEMLKSYALAESAKNVEEDAQVEPAPAVSVISKVPRGIEVLVKKASVDPKFRELLLADPQAAARSIELSLTQFEQEMLGTVSQSQLLAIIKATVVPESQRRVFIEATAATMILAIGGLAVLALGVSAGHISDNPIDSSPRTTIEPPKSNYIYNIRQAVATALGTSYETLPAEPFATEAFNAAAQYKFCHEIARSDDIGLSVYIPPAKLARWKTVKEVADYIDRAVLVQRPVILHVAKVAGVPPSGTLSEKSLVDDLKLDVAQREELRRQFAKTLRLSISWDEFKEMETVDDVMLYVGDLVLHSQLQR